MSNSDAPAECGTLEEENAGAKPNSAHIDTNANAAMGADAQLGIAKK